MSIPFALLRYPRGAKAFGLDFYRYLSRNSTYQNWPYLPPAGCGQPAKASTPRVHRACAVFLRPAPHLPAIHAGNGGNGQFAAREGMDIKYPLSTTLTGRGDAVPRLPDH